MAKVTKNTDKAQDAANVEATTVETVAVETTETSAAAENLPAVNSGPSDDLFSKMDALQSAKIDELIELTSEILKLEAGEEFVGVMTNQTELVEAQEEGKEPFPAVVMYAKNKQKVLCADVVVLSQQKRIFEGVPANETAFKVVRMVNNGERASAKGGGKKYRDIRIYTN